MTQHSEWSPSAADRWIACPASIRLSRGIPRSPAGEAAQIGTAVHSLSQMVLELGVSPNGYIGQEIDGITITDEMAHWAHVYTQFVTDLEQDDYGAALIEKRVTVTNLSGANVFGTADCVAFSDTDCVVADLKTGMISVSPDSPQLKIYACGLLNTVPKTVETFKLVIVQPREEPAIKVHEMSRHDLMAWKQSVLDPAIAETMRADSPTNEGAHCRWCPARSACPEKVGKVYMLANTKEVDALSDTEINALLGVADDAEQTINAIKQRATKALEDGRALADWELVAKRAQRKWRSERQVLEFVSETKGAYKVTPLTPAQMEKQFPEIYQHLDELVTSESSGLTLGRKKAPNFTA